MLLTTATVVAFVALVAAEGAVSMPESALVATPSTCPGSRSLHASPAERRKALVCLINHARSLNGLSAVRTSRQLSRVAQAKGRDVVVCRQFSHEACGKKPFAYVASSGFPFRLVGENLFYAERPSGTARDVFVAWLRSPSHREVMFLSRFSHAGTAVLELDRFSGGRHVSIWVLELAQKA
jgi:uncharacterized protein YkwD